MTADDCIALHCKQSHNCKPNLELLLPEILYTSAFAGIMHFQSNEHGSVPYDGLQYTFIECNHR